MTTAPTTVGIVGVGEVAQRYVDRFLREPAARWRLAFADPDWSATRRYQDAGHPCFKDMSRMIASVRPDVVLILTPPLLHAELAVAAMSDSVRAVVEKPPALTVADLDRIQAAATATALRVDCVAPYRLMPVAQAARRLMRQAAPVRIDITVRWPRHDGYYRKPWRSDRHQGGGPLWNTFFHHVDLAVALLDADKAQPLRCRIDRWERQHLQLTMRAGDRRARLDLSTEPTAEPLERCEIRVGSHRLAAVGRRLSEDVTLDGERLHAATPDRADRAFVEVALASIVGGTRIDVSSLSATIATVEEIYASCDPAPD